MDATLKNLKSNAEKEEKDGNYQMSLVLYKQIVDHLKKAVISKFYLSLSFFFLLLIIIKNNIHVHLKIHYYIPNLNQLEPRFFILSEIFLTKM